MTKSIKLISIILTLSILLFSVSCGNTQSETQETTVGSTTLAPATTVGDENPPAVTTDTQIELIPDEPEEIKNLIIVIGDGMGPIHITSGEMADGKDYSFTSWESSRCNTDSVNASGTQVLTDSAASATALATGTLTINGYVGKDPEKKDLTTIMDIAKEMGKSVGVVTTDQTVVFFKIREKNLGGLKGYFWLIHICYTSLFIPISIAYKKRLVKQKKLA